MRILFFVASALAVGACSSSTTGTSSGGSSSGGSSSGGTSSSSGSSGSTSGSVTLDAESFCERLVNECADPSTTLDECSKTYGTMRVSPACRDAIMSAPCSDLRSNLPSFADTCFPSCGTPGSFRCNGDGTITSCSENGRTVVVDCAAVCTRVASATYSGTCGTTFGGETAANEKCWCQ